MSGKQYEQSASKERNAPVRSKANLAIRILEWLVKLILISSIISIVVEWIGITFFYDHKGALHSLEVLSKEVGWLKSDFNEESTFLGVSPYQVMSILIDAVSNTAMSILDYFDTKIEFGGNFEESPISLFDDYIISCVFVLSTLILRLTILCVSTPVYALAAIVGLVYGLTKREIRKSEGTRESSRKFNLAYNAIIPSLQWPCVLYMSLPFAVHPAWIITPTAAFMMIAIVYSASYFEKVF